MIVDGDGENALRAVLPHDILIEVMLDIGRLFKLGGDFFLGLFPVFRNDVIAEIDAFVTDIDGRPRDQLAYFIAAFPAKGTPQMSIHLLLLGHASSCVTYPWRRLWLRPQTPRT